MHRSIAIAAAAAVLSFVAALPAAVVPAFSGNVAITSDSSSQIFDGGTPVLGYDASEDLLTTNGVPFSGTTTQNGVTLNLGSLTKLENGNPPGEFTNPVFFAALEGNDYSSSSSATVTLSGLTLGQYYELQIFGGYYDTYGTFDKIGNETVNGTTLTVGPATTSVSSPAVTSYTTAIFAADSSGIADITFATASDGSTVPPLLNAVNLQTIAAVPEPATSALLGAGMIGLLSQRRRRRAPGII